jgi:hypothetical protein
LATRLNLFTFSSDDGLAFEVWAPIEMQQRDAPENIGALVAETAHGFAPNLVVGHNRVSADMTLQSLATRLEADASALPGAQLCPARTLTGTAGEVRVTAFTHAGQAGSGPLYQMTACLLSPLSDRDDEDSAGNGDAYGERDLIYLTGTCTVEQMRTWDPAFVDAAMSVRFA